jgi:FixJ family two-component response regulator
MSRSAPLIAVVDDEESVRRALSRLLISSGLDCAAYASGREFLDSLRTSVPDCVVLDLHMPGLTGLDVARELQSAAVRVPAIIITAHDQAGTRSQCLSAGAAAYLRKPFDDKALLDEVTLAMGARHAAH